MKKDLSDEQLDNLMRTVVKDAALDDAAVNDIADSPTIWWGVQRRINEQKAVKSPWPPVGSFWRWFAISGVTAVMAAVLISFFVLKPVDTAKVETVFPEQERNISTQPGSSDNTLPVARVTSDVIRAKQLVMHAVVLKAGRTTNVVKTAAKKPAEIKTDFIALSYARDPESGQIVRVKVPSSMMVTLGLVASVKKPSDMVDAEVLVGDDGLTRAIRFIR